MVLKISPQIKIIQTHLKTIRICNTSRSLDKADTEFSVSIAPDCTVYGQEHASVAHTNSNLSDIYIEFKAKAEEDAFLINTSDKQQPDSNPLLNQAPKGVLTAGQITAYAALQLDSQYRTHTFSVLIIGEYARLIRWDRSGAIVTAPIYYRQDPALLDFFTSYDQAEKQVRGHDDTVRIATQAESRKAANADPAFAAQNLLVVTVPIPGSESKCGEYVIKPPVARPYMPPGRATCTSIAYDIQRNCIVFFKDSWRVACDGIMREGEVYAMLSEKGVPNIPRCSASGDVGQDIYHSTQTNILANASWVVKSTHEFIPHRHHQLILDDIGAKLETFKRSIDMVRAIRAALIGVCPTLSTLLDC